MGKRTKHIFVFIFVFSVFSLTLQASIINSCKVSKAFKTQSQQNPVTEEEEESHDSDESVDEEVLFLSHHSILDTTQYLSKLSWSSLEINYPSSAKNILVPPPKY
ncbi:MAG: hypothetical protein V4677_11065 [Bacteroidota bacterium]